MQLAYLALDASRFADLHTLDDGQLRARGIRRMIAQESPGMPCRVSLRDAAVGESVWLLNYPHHEADSPYRATGPIYVRLDAVDAPTLRTEPPEMLRSRLLSLRAYDARGFLRDADVVEGAVLEPALDQLFGSAKVDYVHVHFAKTGCYALAVRRA